MHSVLPLKLGVTQLPSRTSQTGGGVSQTGDTSQTSAPEALLGIDP
jgi:hypothetical protein